MLRLSRFASCLSIALGLAIAHAHATGDVAGVTATATRPKTPVLIGNAHATLVKVLIDVGKADPSDASISGDNVARNDMRLTSLSFVLDRTDDLADLESLTLLTTKAVDELRISKSHGGERGEEKLTAFEIVGSPVETTSTVTFRTDRPLRKGKNVFWLSARLKPSANLLHQVGASCTAVGTSAGWIMPEDQSPGVRQRVGVALRKGGDDKVYAYGIPALATTTEGTLLCTYDMRWRFPCYDLQDHITTGLSRSTDGGKTWEPMRVIMDMGSYGGLPPEQNGVSDPGLIVDRQTGEIFCFAVWMHGKPGKHQWYGDGSEPGFEIGKAAQLLVVRSKDDGVTWSKPENLTRQLKPAGWYLLAPSPTQGIQLADGTLVMPAQGRNEQGLEFSTLMSSRDHGATWTVGTPAYVRGSECVVAELGDGSLMLNIRNETPDETYFYRAVFITRDLGQTWAPHETNLNRLIEPNCNASLLRVDYAEAGQKKHALLFSNPHMNKRLRTNQTIQVSFDDGRSWPRTHYHLLDEGSAWGYPCLTRIGDDKIGIVYSGSQADLTFQVFTLDELLHK